MNKQHIKSFDLNPAEKPFDDVIHSPQKNKKIEVLLNSWW